MDDLLFVSFDNNDIDDAGLCVTRKYPNGDYEVLKIELGEQARIIYRLLTEQTTKAEIKAESENKG